MTYLVFQAKSNGILNNLINTRRSRLGTTHNSSCVTGNNNQVHVFTGRFLFAFSSNLIQAELENKMILTPKLLPDCQGHLMKSQMDLKWNLGLVSHFSGCVSWLLFFPSSFSFLSPFSACGYSSQKVSQTFCSKTKETKFLWQFSSLLQCLGMCCQSRFSAYETGNQSKKEGTNLTKQRK